MRKELTLESAMSQNIEYAKAHLVHEGFLEPYEHKLWTALTPTSVYLQGARPRLEEVRAEAEAWIDGLLPAFVEGLEDDEEVNGSVVDRIMGKIFDHCMKAMS